MFFVSLILPLGFSARAFFGGDVNPGLATVDEKRVGLDPILFQNGHPVRFFVHRNDDRLPVCVDLGRVDVG